MTVAHVTMLRGTDNVVSNTDAVDIFNLPFIGLEEQGWRFI